MCNVQHETCKIATCAWRYVAPASKHVVFCCNVLYSVATGVCGARNGRTGPRRDADCRSRLACAEVLRRLRAVDPQHCASSPVPVAPLGTRFSRTLPPGARQRRARVPRDVGGQADQPRAAECGHHQGAPCPLPPSTTRHACMRGEAAAAARASARAVASLRAPNRCVVSFGTFVPPTGRL